MSPGPILERSLQRRAAVRYKLQLPVIFHWNDGKEHTAGGFTSDVALDGALILSSKCPPIGSEVRIEVLLPSPDHSGEELRIECTGKVTRIMEQPGYNAFGVHGVFDDDHITRQVLM
jgi:PilZ domain